MFTIPQRSVRGYGLSWAALTLHSGSLLSQESEKTCDVCGEGVQILLTS